MDLREKFMLQLEELDRHLEFDRSKEALDSAKNLLDLYTPAEIYDKFDVEVSHFLGLIGEKLSIELRLKIAPEIKKLIKEIRSQERPNQANWFFDLMELCLGGFPTSKDPREIEHIRLLVANSPESLEIKLLLAMRLVQDSIDNDGEKDFKESLFLFKELYPIFNKKTERQARFRVHFPKDPESLFNTIRTWAILQYSEFLQIHNRLEEARDFLKSQINELWFSRSQENDKTAIRSELKLLEKQIRTGDLIGSKYESRIKQWIAVLIGIPFFVSMMGGILAGNHLQYIELVRLVFVIALSTVLIMGIVLLSLGCDKKQKKSILYIVALIALTLFIFIAPDFSKKSSQLTPPITEKVSQSSEIHSETQTTKVENSVTELTGQSF